MADLTFQELPTQAEATVQPGFKGFVSFCALIDEPLEPFQKRIAKAAFGKAREVAAIIPRGNAKTTLAALIGLHHLLTVENAAVTIGAASRDQARICFDRMAGFAKHPALDGFLEIKKLEISREDRWGNVCLLNVVPAIGEKAHGLSSSLYIGDEVWAWRDEAQLLEAFQTGLIKRKDAKLLLISTAATRLDSTLGRLRTRALAQSSVVVKGAVTEAKGEIHWLEWSLPESDSPDDARAVKRCNPASWIEVADIRRQRQVLQDAAFQQWHCNRWGVGEGSWLPAGAWQACAGDAEIRPGEEVWVGIDIGGNRALSALVMVTQDLRVQGFHWEGDDAVLKVDAFLEQLAGEFTIREVAYDPWRFRESAFRFEEAGLTMVEFPQTDVRMVPASESLYAAVTEKRLTHGNDEVLNANVARAVAKQAAKARGWRIDKAHKEDQIDMVIALCMAIERATTPEHTTQLVGWI